MTQKRCVSVALGRIPRRLLILVLCLTCSAVDRVEAQTDTASYFVSGTPVLLDIYLDSLGIYAPGAPSPAFIEGLLAPLGVRAVRDIGQGIFIAGLAAPISRPELVARSRQALAISGGEVSAAGLAVRSPLAQDPVVVTDEFIVEFLPGVTRTQIDSLNELLGVDTLKQLNVLANDYLLSATPASSLDALELARLYNENPLAVFASPNFIARNRERGVLPAEDDLYASQWHLHNDNDADIDAPEAWNMTRGSSNIVIAVLESSGFDVGNADIAANLFHAWSFAGCSATASFSTSSPCGQAIYTGKLRHGTAVAGLAAARGDNGEGVSGVCPDCSLMLIEMPVSDAAIGATVDYAVAKGASVINNSWGRDITNTYTVAAFNKAATTGRGGVKGTVVVWGVWNKSVDRCVGDETELASMPTGIAVASSNNLDLRAEPTGLGDCIDLLAPGYVALVQSNGDIVSRQGLTTTDRRGAEGYNHLNATPMECLFDEPTSEVNALDYTRCFSGASAAGPIVSGVVGLMLSLRPCLTRAEVQQILRETADKIDPAANYDLVTGHSPTHGYGRVNAAAALTAAGAISCPGGGGSSSATPPSVQSTGIEAGVRVGLTVLTGSTSDEAIINVPGGGPLARPVLYVDWFLASFLFLEGQLGVSKTVNSGLPDESSLGAVLQPSLLYNFGVMSLYAGPNVGLDRLTVGGGPPTNRWGFGGALGLRFKLRPFLAMRVESLLRQWSAPDATETGLAIGVGVVF